MEQQKSGFAEQMPATIGRYQIQGSIGFGAMGAVYKAFDPLIKRTLAIKTIRLDIPRNSPQYKSFIERFYHEARISGTLSHPNIVTLFDIGEEGGLPYLAMEYVEGETIASQIEKGVRFAPEKVVSLVSQVASAIDYAHTKGVIHRDIKPSNMILSEGDRVKVTDFGIAKLVDTEMTQSGTLLGTPSYMSPEQAMGDKLDGRSDIFSLGVCAFEMLSGEQPFPGNNVTSILYKLVHVDPIEPANLEMNGLVPQKWHEVFGKVLAKKPDDRYQTGAEFVQDLEYCLGSWFGGVEATLSEAAQPQASTAPADLASEPTAKLEPSAKAAEAVAEVTERLPVFAAPPAPSAAPAASAKPAPGPAPAPAGLPMTVQMPAPGDEMATVALRAPTPLSEPTLKVPAGETPRHPAAQGKAPAQAPASTPVPRPAAKAATPPPAPLSVTAKAPSPALPRKAVSSLLILGGAGVFFVLAVVIAGIVLFRRQAPEPTPTPVVEAAAPTPVPPEPSAAPAADGALRVETTPPGAQISVNGEARGTAPLDLTGLAVGNYEVRAELRGYEPRTQIATVTSGAPRQDVKLVLARLAPVTGSAEIVSTPPGAAVSLDGAGSGQTPVELKLKPGSHRVELALEGHEPWSGTVTVEAGKKARVEAPLKAIPKPTLPPKIETVDTGRVYLNAASEVDTLARKVSGSSASYPSGAPPLKSGDSVSVSISFVVSEEGEVMEPKVVESGGKQIDEAVLSAVRRWKYAPATKQGVKVKVKITFKQTFRAG